ncbi:hypothetical protein [Halovivax sp.]|uniref:hypothetical protein n=1 Tax=Halovivax sp. TaxID=1935978 RepID=UPI0025BA8091|nr:hypothetical protein [Halovivax sp.]
MPLSRRRSLAVAGVVGLGGGYVALSRLSSGFLDAPDERRYELGRAAVLSVGGMPDRDFELQDDGETVVVEYDHGEVGVYDVYEWAPGVAAAVASETVARVLRTRIPTETLAIGFGAVDLDRVRDGGTDPPAFDAEIGPIVTWPVSLDDAGSESVNPTFDEVVDATPRSVDATLDFDGREYAGRLPVVCEAVRREPY